MEVKPLVSILINNYNYERFLKEAIDSALAQTYPRLEVVVVDDGSTDNSVEIIKSYGRQIIPVFKVNGGQASAFNAGFDACQGDIICFLDSDDIFYPEKVEKTVNFLTEKMESNKFILVDHWLEKVDEKGVPLDNQKPAPIRNYYNLYEFACKYRHFPYQVSPSSGITLSRELATSIFPLPEQGVRTSADGLVGRAALLLGEVHRLPEFLSKYRLHGKNNWHQVEKGRERIRAYVTSQDTYLNEKLKEHQKKPIVSFFDSMYSASYYKKFGSKSELLKLALKTIRWHLDLKTVTFFCRTILFLLVDSFPVKPWIRSGNSAIESD